MRSIEETFNFALGEILPRINPIWNVQDSSSSIFVEQGGLLRDTTKRPDILIKHATTPPVVIECSYVKSDADKDARERLGYQLKNTGHSIETSIALFIPEKFRSYDIRQSRNALFKGEPVYYALHQRMKVNNSYENRRWVENGFIKGTACDVAQLVTAASITKELAAETADEIAAHLEQAASILEEHLSHEEQQSVARVVHQVTNMKGLKTTSILWLNALIVQQRLANLGTQESAYLSFTDENPIPTEVLFSWNKILEKNWLSIFNPAVKSMEIVVKLNPNAASKAISHVLKGVEKIYSYGWEILFNVGAELFPRLSDDRKQAAAFYTQPATAELLASLTIQKNDLNPETWANEKFPFAYQIADLACGTGTLLRAGYQRISRFHKECSGSTETLRSLHKNAMEHGLVGMDVSPIAAHLASSTLAVQGYGDAYATTQIAWCKVGGERNATGSIELFQESQMMDLFESLGHVVHGRQTDDNFVDSISVKNESIQYILMNPPYSRTRGGQSAFDIAGLNDHDRTKCQERWGRLINDEPANKKAGMAATFLALARRKLRLGGRMGFVLPLTAAFAESWSETRAMIENEFEHIVAIAVSGGLALGDQALSADTGMEEMLLICQRKSDPTTLLLNKEFYKGLSMDQSRTIRGGGNWITINCVTLQEPPQRLGEAGEIAREILSSSRLLNNSPLSFYRPIRLGENELGKIIKFHSEGLGKPWSALGINSPDLAVGITALQNGKLIFARQQVSLGIPMCTIGELFEVGPTHHIIGSLSNSTSPSGVFEILPVQGTTDAIGADRCMWHADAKIQNKLYSSATHKGLPKADASNEDLNAIRETASNLFYAKNMRWTSQKILSTLTEQSYLGGRSWLSMNHEDFRIQSVFCIWANSTLGMLLHWSSGQRTQTGRSTTQVNAVREICCPNFRLLSNEKLDLASGFLSSWGTQIFRPACQAHVDSIRVELDDAVIEIFGLPEEAKNIVEKLRFLWCNEPSVHGNNKKALNLLNLS